MGQTYKEQSHEHILKVVAHAFYLSIQGYIDCYEFEANSVSIVNLGLARDR